MRRQPDRQRRQRGIERQAADARLGLADGGLVEADAIAGDHHPELIKGQIVGGAWMTIGHTLCETTAPYYPSTTHAPLDFLNYGMTGVAEMPPAECEVLEHPAESGPFGAKGVGEMVANSSISAILNAINNALDL